MTKYAGRGFTVSLEGDELPQLREFGDFGSTRALIDGTAYGDDWNDYVTGIQDGDEVAFTFAYDPDDATHTDLEDVYENTDGRITLSVAHADAGYGADIACIVNALRHGSPIDGLLSMSGTLKIVEPGVTRTS